MKIKRCPFCGGNPKLMQNYSNKFNSYFVYVECEVCCSKGRTCSIKEDISETSWIENDACRRAVASWNNRVYCCED